MRGYVRETFARPSRTRMALEARDEQQDRAKETGKNSSALKSSRPEK